MIIDNKKLKLINNLGTSKFYLSYPIRKSNGKKRWIDAPIEELKEIQYQILYGILSYYVPHPAAIGFRPGTGLIDGATPHIGQKAVLNLDLKDFFHSVSFAKVQNVFGRILTKYQNNFYFDPHLPSAADLAFLCCYKGRLPQGAPTSPMLSNAAAFSLDNELEMLADKYDLIYTRYADDLTFSHKTGDLDLYEVFNKAKEFITNHGFKVNPKKTRIKRDHQRMTVTGIVVNDKLGIPKWKVKNFRAKLHNLERDQTPITEIEFQQIQGFAQWIAQLNPKKGKRFLETLGNLNYNK